MTIYVDNRNLEDMLAYAEARIEALERELSRLRAVNQTLEQENADLMAKSLGVPSIGALRGVSRFPVQVG